VNALLAILALALSLAVALSIPEGPAAVLLCVAFAAVTGVFVSRVKEDSQFLVRIFVAALLVRVFIGALIYLFKLQEFFGGDALGYDVVGATILKFWQGGMGHRTYKEVFGDILRQNWGMPYMVAGVYAVAGRNMLATQFVNGVIGAATSPVIYLCTRHIFQNMRTSRLAALLVAFYPSLVLWSSQGLKDGPIVFLLAVAMFATLRLGERLSVKYGALLVGALLGVLAFRFYIFYMLAAAIAGAFVIGMRKWTGRSIARQFAAVVVVGLSLTYLGVLRAASAQFERYGSLEAVQRSRADLATSANSGFGQDVDVSTTSGALSVIPLGMAYLLFAPFPWQLASLRQSITLPEMVMWWCSFPLLVLGLWFTLRHRLRRALPILIFTTMLTLAYSVFQGNVGTAYRQRSQILVFYFIFVAVGAVLIKEQREEKRRLEAEAKARLRAARHDEARRSYERWKRERGAELDGLARELSEKVKL
jgi:hypothetical protein